MDAPTLNIRPCLPEDEPLMVDIVGDAAVAYKGVIPADRWREPYMPLAELRAEINAGVSFFGVELAGGESAGGKSDGELVGVMGIQDVDGGHHAPLGPVTLVRHAYVRTRLRGQGIGGALLEHLMGLATRPLLMGTWSDAFWAVRFYKKHGFTLLTRPETERLLRSYWDIPERQVETSVVLADQRALNLLRGANARKVSAADEFAAIDGFWSPRLVGELNGQLVKFVRLKGEFSWHRHEAEDELFWVLEGSLVIRLRERDVTLGPGEFFIIPRGVEHMPVAENECRVMLFEPAATKQYGD